MRAVGVLSPHPHWVIGLGARGLGTVELRTDGADLPPEVDVVVVEPRSADEAGEVAARLRGARDDLGLVLLMEDGWDRPADSDVEIVTTPASVARILEAVLHLRGRVDPLNRLDLDQIMGTTTPQAPGIAGRIRATARVPAVPDVPRVDIDALGPVGVEDHVVTDDRDPDPDPDAVARLRELCDEVVRTHPPLPDAANHLASEVAAAVCADVAVIDHDDGRLLVAGGHGLRPLEWREVEVVPGVLRHLADDRPALCINDTDALRGHLGGLPLSRHRRLLLVSGGVVPLLLVVGREDGFTDEEVQHVMMLVRRAGTTVADALQLRAAAAVLARFDPPR